MIAGFDGAVIPNMKAMMNRMPGEADAVAKALKSQQATGSVADQSRNSVAQAQDQLQGASTIEQKLDILNQTMMQLVSINSLQARTGEKHLKASRGSGNLMSGIGRA